MVRGKQPRQSAADEAHHRADGKIDATRDDDERNADADDAEQRGAADEILQIVAAEETVARERGDDADDSEQPGDAEDFFHAMDFGAVEMCGPLPVARCITASSLSCSRKSS